MYTHGYSYVDETAGVRFTRRHVLGWCYEERIGDKWKIRETQIPITDIQPEVDDPNTHFRAKKLDPKKRKKGW